MNIVHEVHKEKCKKRAKKQKITSICLTKTDPKVIYDKKVTAAICTTINLWFISRL